MTRGLRAALLAVMTALAMLQVSGEHAIGRVEQSGVGVKVAQSAVSGGFYGGMNGSNGANMRFVEFDAGLVGQGAPYVDENGIVMLPAHLLEESRLCAYRFDGVNAEFYRNGVVVGCSIGRTAMTVNGREAKIDAAPVTRRQNMERLYGVSGDGVIGESPYAFLGVGHDYLFVPIESVCDALGLFYEHDAAGGPVRIGEDVSCLEGVKVTVAQASLEPDRTFVVGSSSDQAYYLLPEELRAYDEAFFREKCLLMVSGSNGYPGFDVRLTGISCGETPGVVDLYVQSTPPYDGLLRPAMIERFVMLVEMDRAFLDRNIRAYASWRSTGLGDSVAIRRLDTGGIAPAGV